MNSGVSGQEAAPSRVGIRNHHDLHPVVVGDQRSGPGGTTEASESLAFNEPVVHIHVVVAAKSVVLKVKGAEGEGHHFTLRHLSII